jgi:hypothetical protein
MKFEVFRGQYGSITAELQSKLPSITFGSFKTAKLYATEPNKREDKVIKSIVLSAFIQINNPIINNNSDCFADFDVLIDRLGTDFMWYMAEKHANHIYNTNNWEDNYSQFNSISELKKCKPMEIINLYLDAYVLLDDSEFVAYAKEHGYDGAIHIGNGQTYNELEYRIFSEEQVSNLQEVSCF